MTTHRLKTHPGPFADVEAGRKQFEIRKDDRGFAVGDVLVLEEWSPEKSEAYILERLPVSQDEWGALIDAGRAHAYTGRTCTRVVSYIFAPPADNRYGLQPGYVVLGLSAGGQPL
jgi:hypothetical protein